MIVVTMKRYGMLLLVLLLLLTAAAAAEGPANTDLATPTDLECAHENTKEYVFYENPEYIRIDYQIHKVVGFDAVVRTVCLDCGEILSEETRNQVEEFRNHVFRNGKCAMCGCQQPVIFMTYTQEDIEKQMEKQEETLLLRPEGSNMAVAIPTAALLDILEKNPGKSFRAELQPQSDGSFYAVLVSLTAAQSRGLFGWRVLKFGITPGTIRPLLRIYRRKELPGNPRRNLWTIKPLPSGTGQYRSSGTGRISRN